MNISFRASTPLFWQEQGQELLVLSVHEPRGENGGGP